MFFQIENTPEHIRKARRAVTAPKGSPKEECPRLILAPFTSSPKVVFENVLIGSSCERNLEVFNPSKQVQQITLGKSLPPGLVIHLPQKWLVLEPETCYCLSMFWTPTQPTAMRETIRFTNENKGRYDVIVILKSVMNIKGKGVQSKGFKISPGKIKKKATKKSPIAMYKTKSELIYNTTQIKKTFSVIHSQQKYSQLSNKENMSVNDYYNDSRAEKCPFDSPSSGDFNFNTSEVFSNFKQPDVLQQTYDKAYTSNRLDVPQNVLKPSNRQPCDVSATELFDNLTFTPLKDAHGKGDKLDKGPKIILSMNSESDLDDSIEICNKENQTHSIITVTSSQPPNKWLLVNQTQETPNIPVKKHPNTSSPKEMNSPNFSINTDFSRISELSFYPQRFSTERKCFPKSNNDTHEIFDDPIKLSSDTYTKDSPNTPMEAHFNQMNEMRHLFLRDQPKLCKQSLFKEFHHQKEMYDENNFMNNYEHNVWKNGARAGIRSTHNDLRTDVRSLQNDIRTDGRPLRNDGRTDVRLLRNDGQTDVRLLQNDMQPNVRSWPWHNDMQADVPLLQNNRQMNVCSYQNEMRTDGRPLRNDGRTDVRLLRNDGRTDVRLLQNDMQPNVRSWQNDMLAGAQSPPRSITPPLQSIPEESVQFSDTQILDRTDRQQSTFTMNRTFDKASDRCTISRRASWSKKAVRAEPDLWKIPITHVKKIIKNKSSTKSKDLSVNISDTVFDTNKSIIQNMSVNQLGNVYSQSTTVDPFLSKTYFYDEEAVEKFETEFKRWLNCILTPPADLDCNIEQKIDVGKAWIENRNKEVPAAPTKEQVSCAYHSSHRLVSLRKSARALLMSPEIAQVFQKLNAQIEKKLIVIRNDRNLHLDIGLQKTIMEILLSYNPLWLRIGLEAIYGIVLPLKSNSDIEGITTFIIHRMFKNPFLKNKHSKSSAPNMLLPAYMEAIKKFTLKKFFMLIFFLDQAKQRKLISHDPCLFCRNAPCKESREIIIRFTRELIAGIGDITKHLRPLGYIVCHKQTYLDEYKYAVHNIALDIRDGVRLTKVMEIILMKDDLLNQLRAPAISRLQKIHNVQVALNALKEANYVIVGDISSNDIADGHREKTLSLLWQIIHVFRAPLFERAANVIQIWWRRKYAVIAEQKKEAERILQKKNNAAIIIQCWWRQIQNNRYLEWQMQQITNATIVIQRYCRMWRCRTRLMKVKRSVLKIEEWYRSVKKIREAKAILVLLRLEREELQNRSAIILQSYVRRWLCVRHYTSQYKKIVVVQSLVRRFLIRTKYIEIKKAVLCVQQRYKAKLLMKKQIEHFARLKTSVVLIQSYYRMLKHRKQFLKLKHAVNVFEEHYLALIQMRTERNKYLELKRSTIIAQALYKRNKCRKEYLRQRDLLIYMQRKIRAKQLMKKDKEAYLKLRTATITIQSHIRSYILMIKLRQQYMTLREATIRIQRYFRSYLLCKSQRNYYLRLQDAAIKLQMFYRSVILMREQRSAYLKLKKSAIDVQRRYRAKTAMKSQLKEFTKLRQAAITIQNRYKAQVKMRLQRSRYLKLKSSCTTIQNAYRAFKLGKQQRKDYLKIKNSATKIQTWYRTCKKGKEVKQQYQQSKQACVTIQRVYRAYIIGRKQRQEFIRIRIATILIQTYYRSYIEMKTVRQQYIHLKTATITIQRYYKSHLETKKQRQSYLHLKHAAVLIGDYYKRYRETKMIRNNYLRLINATLFLQKRYRSIRAMRTEKEKYLKLRQSIIMLQQKYKALLQMRKEKQAYIQKRNAVITIQRRFKAYSLMKLQKNTYYTILQSCIKIQRFYRAYIAGKTQRQKYLQLRDSAVSLQRRYRALLTMRRHRDSYFKIKSAAMLIQNKYRAHCLMLKERQTYVNTIKACITIQRMFRAYVCGTMQRSEYITIKKAVILIQRRFRSVKETKKIQSYYNELRRAVLLIQRRFRAYKNAQLIKQKAAVRKIQNWVVSIKKRDECRQKFMTIKKNVIIIQSIIRMRFLRKQFIRIRNATLSIQRYYRGYNLTNYQRMQYIKTITSIITIQSYVRRFIMTKRYNRIRSAALTIQSAYRLKKLRDVSKQRRLAAVLCLQKYVRRYQARSRYLNFLEKVRLIQTIWRGKLVTRLMRCEYLQKRTIIIKFQAILRGYLVRKQMEAKKVQIQKTRQEQIQYWAASKIQALCRGHIARVNIAHDIRVAELRQRWRQGGLKSTQESMRQRNDEAMEVLRNISSIEAVIKAFRSLELLTEVFPAMYKDNASSIVHRVYTYMSVTNRSISSIEVLKSAAAVLVNLTRCSLTGPKIYLRDRIQPILKFMWRFSNSEIQLFCIMATYLWLFSKYEQVKEDLTELLNTPENHRMLMTIKGNVDRTKRMTTAIMKNKFHTPQSTKFVSHTHNLSLNASVWNVSSIVLPALEPDYGIVRVDKPPYFEDAQQAIHCLFYTYKL